MLQFLAALLKSATQQSFSQDTLAQIHRFCTEVIISPDGSGTRSNPLFRRLRAKIYGRLAYANLPRANLLDISGPSVNRASATLPIDDGIEVPNQVEEAVSDLLELLSDSVSVAGRLASLEHG